MDHSADVRPAIARALSHISREQLVELVLEQRDEIEMLTDAVQLLKARSPLVAWLVPGRAMTIAAIWALGVGFGFLSAIGFLWSMS